MSTRATRRLQAGWWLWLAIAAMCLRALIPQGYMLASRGEASPLALCPAQSAELVAALASRADAHHHHHHHHGGDGAPANAHGSPECAFALAGAAPLPAAAPAVALPALLLLVSRPVQRLRGFEHPRRSAAPRGPPHPGLIAST